MSKLTRKSRHPARADGRTHLTIRAARAAAIALTLSLTACGDFLAVDLPTRVPAEVLNNPSLAGTLVLGAQADFECAFSEYIVSTGAWTDEFINATGWREATVWTQRLGAEYDAGTGNCPTTTFRGGFTVYLPLQLARGQAENAYSLIEGFNAADVPNREELLAKSAAYAGYATTLLGEAYCEMALDGGPVITPAEVLLVAETRFTTALGHAQAAGSTELANLARVGRARVRNYLGQKAQAAQDAELVSEGFVYNATYATSIPRRMNTININNNLNQALSVDPRFRGLEVNGVPDPRVPVQNAGRLGNDAVTPSWVQMRFPNLDSPVPIASWNEAQLIIAEAAGGQVAVAAINRLRDHWGLPNFASNDGAEIAAQIIEERRRELFLQGHRLSDHLRFGLPFNSGANHKGVAYAEEFTCLPLPPAER